MIEEHKFGSFVINGRQYLGDIKIVDTRVKHWEDREHHELKIKDLKEILEINPELIVIGTGNSGYLEIPSELKDLIRSRRINLIVDKNQNAVIQYNQALIQNKKIGAIFHATC